LQNGADSWAAIKRWDVVLQGDPLSDEEYKGIHPLIIKSLSDHYVTQEPDGTLKPIVGKVDFQINDYNFADMRGLFLSIYRRQGGNSMLEMTDKIRDKVKEELGRLEWQKSKPPEANTWYVLYCCLCFSYYVTKPHQSTILIG
jgi:hypothetical protein